MSSAAAMPMMDGGARRRHPRYQVSFPFDITVFRPSAVTRLSGQAQDLGEGGLSGIISGAALPGERVEITLVLPGSSEPFNTRAVVRHESNLYCGFEFLSLDQAQREQLQELSADPDLQASLISETECEVGLEPPLHGGAPLCSACGEELPEEISVCLACGAPRADDAFDPQSAPPLEVPAATHQPERASDKTRRPFEMDSLIAIIFLITLMIGLWEWLHAPADTGADSQPSAVTVALENAFLRPSSTAKHDSWAVDFNSNAVLAEAGSVVSAIIGSASPVRVAAAAERPQNAANNNRRQEQPRPSSNSQTSLNAAESSAPSPVSSEPGAPAPSPLLSAPAAANAEAPADSSNSVTSGGNAASQFAGTLLQKVLPMYPAQAQREGVQGQVVLKAVIGKDGTIAELTPLQGPQQLTAAAMDAVQHWRFRPYEVNGKPAAVETNIRLNFQLPQKQ